MQTLDRVPPFLLPAPTGKNNVPWPKQTVEVLLCSAGGTIAAGELVVQSGVDTINGPVVIVRTANSPVLGVALEAAVSGARVMVAVGGFVDVQTTGSSLLYGQTLWANDAASYNMVGLGTASTELVGIGVSPVGLGIYPAGWVRVELRLGQSAHGHTLAQINTLLGHISKATTADHTINNSALYVADNDFQGIALEANSIYAFEAAITWQLTVSANPDWKVRFCFTQTDWTMFCTYVASATASANDSAGTNYCTIGTIAQSATGSRLNVFHGTIRTVTAGTFQMEWAQNAATAEDTIRRHPSWMRFLKAR